MVYVTYNRKRLILNGSYFVGKLFCLLFGILCPRIGPNNEFWKKLIILHKFKRNNNKNHNRVGIVTI